MNFISFHLEEEFDDEDENVPPVPLADVTNVERHKDPILAYYDRYRGERADVPDDFSPEVMQRCIRREISLSKGENEHRANGKLLFCRSLLGNYEYNSEALAMDYRIHMARRQSLAARKPSTPHSAMMKEYDRHEFGPLIEQNSSHWSLTDVPESWEGQMCFSNDLKVRSDSLPL